MERFSCFVQRAGRTGPLQDSKEKEETVFGKVNERSQSVRCLILSLESQDRDLIVSYILNSIIVPTFV